MNSKLEMAQDRFIESIGKLAESFGLNKFMAQLYGMLYLSNNPHILRNRHTLQTIHHYYAPCKKDHRAPLQDKTAVQLFVP